MVCVIVEYMCIYGDDFGMLLFLWVFRKIVINYEYGVRCECVNVCIFLCECVGKYVYVWIIGVRSIL